ncbi:class I tRNA ligase family protein [Clostridium oryzae]|uniref:Methionine--tRNA ligase n=1 Tax=Clostridium oryzae TaxID=1450648 RepID=A0A1V4IMP5_9CLOT|nr:class I tRNA ligase family protein [Clostridium oryzae]OPJ61302.1 methionine--tRNA ligase [Clostridium oryzae]
MEQKIYDGRIYSCNKIYVDLDSLEDVLRKDVVNRYNMLKSNKSHKTVELFTRDMKLPFILKNCNVDSIRYFIISNQDKNRGALENLVMENNNKLLGILGNYINRCLIYVKRYFGGKLPAGNVDTNIKKSINNLYDNVGKMIESKQFNSALDEIFIYIKKANEYFDNNQPWIQVDENRSENEQVLYNCIIIIANLSNLLEPFMPECCSKIRRFLDISIPKWEYIEETKIIKVNKLSPLFDWIDIDDIKDDIKKYNYNSLKGGIS